MAALEDSPFGRLIGVLVSPGKTFRSIAGRPTWGAALITLILATTVLGFVTAQRTDYRDVITRSVAESGRDVPAEALDRQISFMEKAGPYFSLAGSVFVILITLFSALLYWVAFKLLGGEFSYKSSFSVVLHAGMPVVVSVLLSLPVVLSRARLGYDDVKSGSFLQSNLAFLAPEGARAWVTALYASADFFAVWSLILSVIGFKALSRLSTQAVAVTVVVISLLFVAVRVGLATLR
jgi:hypothetical protein